jgi:hypothetical protein
MLGTNTLAYFAKTSMTTEKALKQRPQHDRIATGNAKNSLVRFYFIKLFCLTFCTIRLMFDYCAYYLSTHKY